MSTALQAIDTTGDLPQLFELAKQLVPTGFLPAHLKTPGQVVAVILAGRELGMPPMRSLRSLVLVKGKVVESADSQLGRFKAAGGKATFEKHDDTEAVLKLTHPNGDEHTERFTIADAKRAGLTSNPTWSSYPKAMLRSRAITAGLKSVGWDGGAGVYEPGELGEDTSARPEPTVIMPRAKALPKPEPVVEPVEDERPSVEAALDEYAARLAEEEPAPPTPAVISRQQQVKLFAAITASKHTEEEFREWLQRVAGLDTTKLIPATKLDAILRRLEDETPLAVDYSKARRVRR